MRFIRWFDETSLDDIRLVGGKNASLGELFTRLQEAHIPVPYGFSITTDGFSALLAQNDGEERVKAILRRLNPHSLASVKECSVAARGVIESLPLPTQLSCEIIEAYRTLSAPNERGVSVAVRSSATAEDLPTASFAGQQESFLNVRGEEALLRACRQGFSSLYTERAITYRAERGIEHVTKHGSVRISLGVQRMVRSDLGASGVVFTIDTESGFRDVVVVHAVFGLGEALVQGLSTPDEYVVFKPTLKQGFRPILNQRIGEKGLTVVYTSAEDGGTEVVQTRPELRVERVLSDEEILTLARWGCVIEEHYSKRYAESAATPMDIEWAKDGVTGELFIVQARPETAASRLDAKKPVLYHLPRRGEVLVSGSAVGDKIASGAVRLVRELAQLTEFQNGEVLVTERTSPELEPVMKRASAIVTDHGGRTSHAAIVSRELGIPCVVGTKGATGRLVTGEAVTVSCAEGEVGYVYRGRLPYEYEELDLESLPQTESAAMMNLGEPHLAFELARLPHDGVGLCRLEFIINSDIQIHPLALTDFDALPEGEAKREIARLTAGYRRKGEYFIDKLAWGVGRIAAAVAPKPCIVRLSDFKSDEYRSLLGGELFEPVEENPMIGWRGASRYYSPTYERAFRIECEALRRVRDEFGLKNVRLMVPFCRTVEEGKRVLALLEEHGLKRGEDGLSVYVMCEIPANALLAERFLEHFDGFSIGSNDLTQLTLGVDRNSELLASLYDERNEAVIRLISLAAQAAAQRGRYLGICGDAPSTYPDFLRTIVKLGVRSLSFSPDMLVKGRALVAACEHEERRVWGVA